MPVEPQSLRATMRRWATGVTVVTSRHGDLLHGITVNSFTSLSLDPPLCLVCIDKRAKAHEEIPRAGHFAVNILSAEQAEIANRFAGRRPELTDLFADLALQAAPSGAPVFAGILGYLDCRLHERLAGGDHTIFIGWVEHAQTLEEGVPLLFYGGAFRQLAPA